MRSYRLFFLGRTGVLFKSVTLNCAEDREVIAIAERELRECEYVEIWNGGRPVCMCAGPLAKTIRHYVADATS
jgi:hypothetical protein